MAATEDKELNTEVVLSLEQQLNELNGKINMAEEKKTTVKPDIYRKVKADYETKKTVITKNLGEELKTLKIECERLKKEEEELKGKQGGIEDELDEVNFRQSLGEYSDEQYSELSKEKTDAIESIGAEIAQLANTLQPVKEIVDRVEEALKPKKAKPEEAPVTPPVTPRTEGAVHVSVEPELVISEGGAVVEEPQTKTPLDDIAKELEEEMVTPQAEELVADEEPELVIEEEEPSLAESTQPSEEEKEINCPKCGYPNMSDSWYCERCGAELLQGSGGGGA
jgi:hypothetical protein